jgi:type II secretory pathway predicted ATPase ExeA
MPTPTSTSSPRLRKLLERSERVFPSYPQVAQYFPAESVEAARQRLSRTIERGDGPGLVVGAAGTGKSLLLQVLAAQFQERFDVVLLACARVCTRRALIQAILFEMGLRYHARDEGALRLSLLDHLLSVEECPEGLLMLVDEAQALPPALLDELRVLTNLVRGGTPRVRLVLSGTAALDESFAGPELESFSQRLSARCYLAPFTREETIQFIRAQVAAAGVAPDDIFAQSAWTAIFDATDGVPRLINQLCDRALLLADAKQHMRIERETVQAAWADLQQLPPRWETTTGAPAADTPNVVEFGGLPEDDPVEPARDAEQYFVVDPVGLNVDAASNYTACNYAIGDATINDASMADYVADHCSTHETTAPEAVAMEVPAAVELPAIDPFTEKFDEEEMVLDSYAAWDRIFHREVPRVENRRDPAFATLVQAALDAAPNYERRTKSPTFKLVPAHGKLESGSADASTALAFEDEFGDPWGADFPSEDKPAGEDWSHWTGKLRPPLRLADVAEPGPLAPDARLGQQTLPGAVSYDTQPHAAAGRASDWLAQVAIEPETEQAPDHHEMTTLSGRPWEKLPVLVIDEDRSEVPHSEKPTVRREEYRDLFSRLRGV